MFGELAIQGFQSLQDVVLKLKPFTVIVGPTGSGKSSVVRAARLCAFNARGTAYITRGQASCTVELSEEIPQGRVAVTIRRGIKDSYHLEHPVPVPTGGYGQSGCMFKKLAGQTPPEITEALQLSELNFAGQFDRPFLLTESAGEVARVLGKLTNVSLIFAAAREAVRRKNSLAADLRAAEAEVARLSAQLPRFATLPQRVEALRRAEDALSKHAAKEALAHRLQALLSQYEAAQAALELAPPPAPSLERLDTLESQYRSLHALVADGELAARWVNTAKAEQAKQELAAAQADAQIHELLVSAGRCPTCGQPVHADAHAGG